MSKPSPLYIYLQKRLAQCGINQEYLCELLGRQYNYVHDRMFGLYPWSQNDQYIIMEAINEPPSRLHIVFPKEGIGDPAAREEIDPIYMMRQFGEFFIAMADKADKRPASQIKPHPRFQRQQG